MPNFTVANAGPAIANNARIRINPKVNLSDNEDCGCVYSFSVIFFATNVEVCRNQERSE
jgi:hypothetical protein